MDRPVFAVQVRHDGFSSYTDLAPMLDALKAQFGTVRAQVITPDGSGRGGGFGVPLDILFEVVERADLLTALFLKDFISELAKDAYKGVRQTILDFREKHRNPEPGAWRLPFSIFVGGLRFVFDPPLTDDEFIVSLNAARALADTLPDETISNPEGPGGFYYTWDAASKAWQGPHHP